MSAYLPWWITAISLSIVTLGFYALIRSPLGVSGSWARVVMWKNDKLLDEAELPFQQQPKLFEDALMAATIQEFGEKAVTEFMQERHKGKPTKIEQEAVEPVKRIHWTAHMVFLLTLMLGGALGAFFKGDASIQLSLGLGSLHSELFGTGFASIMTLFIGGILVGFGTQLGGGCTSGHGLSGVSRLVPASLIAMASFFGAAVVFSMAIHYLK